jgi:hypothetical protein
MIDADFINAIAGLAAKAELPKTLKPKGMPASDYYMLQGDGTYDRVSEKVHSQFNLHEMPSMAQWIAQKAQTDRVEVFVDGLKVVAYAGDHAGLVRDAATMKVEYSVAFRWFESLAAEKKVFDQKGMIRLLQTTLRGLLSDSVVTQFRVLKFTQNSAVSQSVQASKANIGKTLESEITGSVPDVISFSVPIYNNARLMVGSALIDCPVDVDLTTGNFTMTTSPDQMNEHRFAARGCLLANIIAAVGHLTGEVTDKAAQLPQDQISYYIGEDVTFAD